MRRAAFVATLIASGLCGVLVLPPAVEPSSSRPSAADAAPNLSPAAAKALEAKIQVLSGGGSNPLASSRRIEITDAEANSYLKYCGHEFLPGGVRDPSIHITPEGVSGTAVVDFAELNQGAPNPDDWGAKFFAWIFRGKFRVSGMGKLQTGNGQGKLTIEKVAFDNKPVPPVLVNFLIENYVSSRYKIDLSKPFDLPDNVTHIELGHGQATFYRNPGKTR